MYFFQRNKFKIIITAVTLILVFFLAGSSLGGGKVPVVSEIINVITAPVQKIINGISSGVGGFFSSIGANKNYARENEDLKKQIASLEDKLRENDALTSENTRLRRLLELREKDTEREYIAADIVANDLTNWSHTFTVDKGLVDGVTKNCAVVSSNGLVGYVYETGRTWAKVITIMDSSVSVGAKITRLNINSVISGDIALAQDSKCVMNYISKDTNVELGDYAVTSGNGGIYPQGLYIGKIVELLDDVSGLSQVAIIEPGTDFHDLSEVMIIKK